jgi:hypothetical protein
VIDKSERQALLNRIAEDFGVQLLWCDKLASPGYREDVTTHGFFDPEDKLTEGLKRDIRRWVENQGWQFSRQMVKHPTVADRWIEYIYLAPMIPVPWYWGITLRGAFHFPRSDRKACCPAYLLARHRAVGLRREHLCLRALGGRFPAANPPTDGVRISQRRIISAIPIG